MVKLTVSNEREFFELLVLARYLGQLNGHEIHMSLHIFQPTLRENVVSTVSERYPYI